MHARPFINAYILCTCDIGQRRKPKGHPNEKLQELSEIARTGSRQSCENLYNESS
ncbi:hypothetical protein LguiA_029770 [Lonicera macranthoides]